MFLASLLVCSWVLGLGFRFRFGFEFRFRFEFGFRFRFEFGVLGVFAGRLHMYHPP